VKFPQANQISYLLRESHEVILPETQLKIQNNPNKKLWLTSKAILSKKKKKKQQLNTQNNPK
jgi:hypothetical protein